MLLQVMFALQVDIDRLPVYYYDSTTLIFLWSYDNNYRYALTSTKNCSERDVACHIVCCSVLPTHKCIENVRVAWGRGVLYMYYLTPFSENNAGIYDAMFCTLIHYHGNHPLDSFVHFCKLTIHNF